jgi:hypothetical protein
MLSPSASSAYAPGVHALASATGGMSAMARAVASRRLAAELRSPAGAGRSATLRASPGSASSGTIRPRRARSSQSTRPVSSTVNALAATNTSWATTAASQAPWSAGRPTVTRVVPGDTMPAMVPHPVRNSTAGASRVTGGPDSVTAAGVSSPKSGPPGVLNTTPCTPSYCDVSTGCHWAESGWAGVAIPAQRAVSSADTQPRCTRRHPVRLKRSYQSQIPARPGKI